MVIDVLPEPVVTGHGRGVVEIQYYEVPPTVEGRHRWLVSQMQDRSVHRIVLSENAPVEVHRYVDPDEVWERTSGSAPSAAALLSSCPSVQQAFPEVLTDAASRAVWILRNLSEHADSVATRLCGWMVRSERVAVGLRRVMGVPEARVQEWSHGVLGVPVYMDPELPEGDVVMLMGTSSTLTRSTLRLAVHLPDAVPPAVDGDKNAPAVTSGPLEWKGGM